MKQHLRHLACFRAMQLQNTMLASLQESEEQNLATVADVANYEEGTAVIPSGQIVLMMMAFCNHLAIRPLPLRCFTVSTAPGPQGPLELRRTRCKAAQSCLDVACPSATDSNGTASIPWLQKQIIRCIARRVGAA